MLTSSSKTLRKLKYDRHASESVRAAHHNVSKHDCSSGRQMCIQQW
uniref:Uncharacterized protein n=1 Tax=Rhizophora mucronata TaxID=61149 RepID=A0A2P2PNE4_RHIMU